jgi:hypothetical protein
MAYANPDAPTQIANGVSTTDIYNLYHNNSSGSPGLGQATQLVSGQNDEGPINMNSKCPDWLKTIIRIAAGTTIASGLACGELGPDECIQLVRTEANFFFGSKPVQHNTTPQLPSGGNSGGMSALNSAVQTNQQFQNTGGSSQKIVPFGNGNLVLTPGLLPRSLNRLDKKNQVFLFTAGGTVTNSTYNAQI